MGSWQEALKLTQGEGGQLSGSSDEMPVFIVNDECLTGETVGTGSLRWDEGTQTCEVTNVSTAEVRGGLVTRSQVEDAMDEIDVGNSDWFSF